MTSTVFRNSESSSQPVEKGESTFRENKVGGEYDTADIEPLEVKEQGRGDVLLESLGVDDEVENLSHEDKQNVLEIKQYIENRLKAEGLDLTTGSFKKMLAEIRSEMGLSDEAPAETVITRIGGIVKAWKDLSFVDPKERRGLFFKLAQMKDSKEMNKFVYQQMEKYQLWR